MFSDLYIELKLSQRRRPIDISWMDRESYRDSQFQSMKTATQQLPVSLPEHKRDESTLGYTIVLSELQSNVLSLTY